MVAELAAQRLSAHSVQKLEIFLFGQPRVLFAGSPVALIRKQTRALLYLLASQTEPVSREKLGFLFWADQPEMNARRHLTRQLTHLRRLLPDPRALVTQADQVLVNAEYAWCDSAVFNTLCQAQASEQRVEELRKAVSLYQQPFLDGFTLPKNREFEEWVNEQRQRFERAYLDALAWLMEFEIRSLNEPQKASDAYHRLINYAQRYLEIDGLDEKVHRRLIEAYAATGNRRAALRQFEACSAALKNELGLEPLPETIAVYQAALHEGEDQPQSLPTLREAVNFSAETCSSTFVGREELLRQLEHTLEAAASGQSAFILLSGEPGSGKTSLLKAFAARISGKAILLYGESYASAQDLPFQPVIQALRPKVAAYGASERCNLVWLAEAAFLFPEARSRLHTDENHHPQSRVSLFEALCQILVSSEADTRPVALCLDDLHWAGEDTLDWLIYLAGWLRDQGAGKRLLVLGTFDSLEREALSALQQRLSRLGLPAEIPLPRFNRVEFQEMVRLVSGQHGSAVLGVWLEEATGGIPLYGLEMLRACCAAGKDPEQMPRQPRLLLTAVVREAVNQCLRRLSPIARRIIEAAAVLKTPLEVNHAACVLGLSELEVVDGFDELAARQLLADGGAGYQFTSLLIRQVIVESLSQVRRHMYYRRATEMEECGHLLHSLPKSEVF